MTATGIPVVEFDSTDQDLVLHDLELFERVRAAGGIAWSEKQGGLWVVSDYALCRQIAADHETFSSADGVRFPRALTSHILALEYDRPTHTRHRAILTELVGPRVTPPLERMVREHAGALLDRLSAAEIADLGADYAYPLPLDVIFSLIGAPESIKSEMETLSESLFLYRRPMPDGSDPAKRLQEILDGLIADSQSKPDDSWISRVIARANDHAGDLDEAEVRGALTAVLTGGHHSTARGLACLMAQIVEDPELQQLLRDEPARIPAIVEESLRLNTPLRWFARTAARDTIVGNMQVRKGERLYLLYAAANLDPAKFADPSRMHHEGRKASEHLAFGWGIHRCVGMPLAQLELRVAVEELLAATSWISLEAEVEWHSTVVYTRVAFKPDYSDMIANSPLLAMSAQKNCLVDGTPAADIAAELAPRAGETVICHQRVGGFHASQLDLVLRRAGVDTVVFAGVATNLSVEGTARAASDHGYRTIVVTDACSAGSLPAHEASVESLALLAEIATTDEVLDSLVHGVRVRRELRLRHSGDVCVARPEPVRERVSRISGRRLHRGHCSAGAWTESNGHFRITP
ncbi:isochorismatase family protein [Mycolicibacterium sp. 120266]|uniref:isochorismatase family protein n=1 Tax=Mycolicibacterium sp. 120266 TaxID=3090601 RepID=UPI00299D37E3|nr:isochorismatase family protein [Mycolicibacterium sp. 120266]MDX1874119.1 isochorismatase family protein [Mycolicibacterium sp. 120266]